MRSWLLGLLAAACAAPPQADVHPSALGRLGAGDRSFRPPHGDVARAWAEQLAGRRGLTLGDRVGLEEHGRVTGKASVVMLRVTVDGAPVLDSDLRVLVDEASRVAGWSAGDRFGPLPPAVPAAKLDGPAAVARALEDRLGVHAGVTEQGASGGWSTYAVSGLSTTARARRVWVSGAALRPAWEVELVGRRPQEPFGWRVVVADDGAALQAVDLLHDAFTYRAWADATGARTPADSPWQDASPHPTGTPDGLELPPSVPAALHTIEGLNTGPTGAPDPWLAPGATLAVGNNIDVFTDVLAQGATAPDTTRAMITAPGVFDPTFDPTLSTTDGDAQAALVQAFYTGNWLHDWYYDAGFTEAAGNGQLDNLGRGGVAFDRVEIAIWHGYELGDQGNARMLVPSDGSPPKMFVEVAAVRAEGLLQAGGLELAWARADFGPQAYDLTADLIDAVDSTGSTLACAPITADLSGQIALIDRGACPFTTKVAYAQAAGAVGVLVADNLPNGPMDPLGGFDPSITIPSMRISQADGYAVRAALAAGPVEARMHLLLPFEIDIALDATVLAHEWGHLLHFRLAACSEGPCLAISEGWGDVVSVLAQVREGDDLEGSWAVGAYSAPERGPAATWYGYRRAPYSLDRSKAPLSFRHISDGEPLPTTAPMWNSNVQNSETHNAGEVWASAVLDGYLRMQQTRDGGDTFEDVQRRMGAIVVAGMALAPPDAGWLESRDAFLAAARLIDADDARVLAEAFAGRGMGACAVGPTPGAPGFAGVVEDGSTGAAAWVGDARLVAGDCDGDAILDGGETGAVRLTVRNLGLGPLVGATVTGVVQGGLATIQGPVAVPPLAPLEAIELDLPVTLDPATPPLSPLVLEATIDAPGSCALIATVPVSAWVNADGVDQVATEDNFRLDFGGWVAEGGPPGWVWSRQGEATLDPYWNGAGVGFASDTRLVGPALEVSTAAPLVVTFDARWSFEYTDVAWDGAVLELSVDGGPWVDVSRGADPGYQAVLWSEAGNPLGGRPAWGGTNPSWPATDTITLDLGDAFAGRTVRLGVRIGTDQATSDHGFDLYRFAATGITNTPFPAHQPQVDACGPALVADAGPDRSVVTGEAVELDGSATVGPTGVPLSFTWTQVDGPPVTLTGADQVSASFVAPAPGAALTFELQVADGVDTRTDTVTLSVVDAPPVDTDPVVGDSADTDGADTDDVPDTDVPDTDAGQVPDPPTPTDGEAKEGCGCQTAHNTSWVALGLLFLRRRR